MSQSQQINRSDAQLDVAPTPQNTPLDTQVLANRPANQGRPQVEDIGEGEEDDDDQDEPEGANPASLLAKVSLGRSFFCCKILLLRDDGYIVNVYTLH
jgi:nucleosome assembly protein 1-like 1